MKILLILSFTFIYFFDPCLADMIYLKDNSIINGQLIKITPSVIIIETYKDNGNLIQNISVNRSDVDKIIDESEIILFEKNTQLKSELEKFYFPISSIISSIRKEPNSKSMDTLYGFSGSYKIGFIKKMSPRSLVFEIHQDSDTTETILSKLNYVYIWRINGINIRKFKDRFFRKELHRVAIYPQVSFELGGSISFTQLADLKNVFQNFYDIGECEYLANEVQSSYLGIQFTLLLKFTRYIGIAAISHANLGTKEDNYRLFIGELRYYQYFKGLRPWFALGYGRLSVKVIDKAHWGVGSEGFSIGLGIETGEDCGLGFFTALRYLPFGEKETTTDIYDHPNSYSYNLGKTDLSVFALSLGIRFNY